MSAISSIRNRERINKTRSIIRKKLRLLREGENVRDEKLKLAYTPITEPLTELISTGNQIKNEIANKNATKKADDPKFFIKKEENKIPAEAHLFDSGEETVFESYANEDDRAEPDILSQGMENVDRIGLEEYLEQYDPLPRFYIEKLITDGVGDFDTQYGISYDVNTSKWTVGDSEVTLDGKDLIIKGVRYSGTPGIYELLFKKHPIGYNPDDLKSYRKILDQTHSLFRNYDPKKQIQGTRSAKYNLIKSIMKGKSRFGRSNSWTGMGGGMILKGKSSTEYRYWDNLDELVDRLEKLHASKLTGNSSHSNEILNIEEELREAAVII